MLTPFPNVVRVVSGLIAIALVMPVGCLAVYAPHPDQMLDFAIRRIALPAAISVAATLLIKYEVRLAAKDQEQVGAE